LRQWQAASGYALRSLPSKFNPTEKPNEKVTAKPASRYSYPQLAFKLPTLAPGQNSIGTGGQYSIGADSIGELERTSGGASGAQMTSPGHWLASGQSGQILQAVRWCPTFP
jgi:hypothetical protein